MAPLICGKTTAESVGVALTVFAVQPIDFFLPWRGNLFNVLTKFHSGFSVQFDKLRQNERKKMLSNDNYKLSLRENLSTLNYEELSFYQEG